MEYGLDDKDISETTDIRSLRMLLKYVEIDIACIGKNKLQAKMSAKIRNMSVEDYLAQKRQKLNHTKQLLQAKIEELL